MLKLNEDLLLLERFPGLFMGIGSNQIGQTFPGNFLKFRNRKIQYILVRAYAYAYQDDEGVGGQLDERGEHEADVDVAAQVDRVVAQAVEDDGRHAPVAHHDQADLGHGPRGEQRSQARSYRCLSKF